MPPRFEMPPPSDEARAHSDLLFRHIEERIASAGGWIDFSQFMDLALYAPGLGYYAAGATKFGPAGDFVTAPEVSPLFGRCLARACADWLSRNADGQLVEVGAGTGSLAVELIGALDRLGVSPLAYLIMEPSADLRERQMARVAALPAAQRRLVRWLDTLPAGPLRAIVIANEVADALPVARFVRRADGVNAQGVVIAGPRFSWSERPADRALARAVAAIEDRIGRRFDDGYASEVSLRLPGWIRAIGDPLEQGAVVICDYGMSAREYYHPERRDGTLVCHYRHRAHGDPFLWPGLQDISAWVDFSALADAATAAGLAVAGYSTQAHFLLDTGLAEELAGIQAVGGHAAAEAAGRARTLLMPGEMGERFKVMALVRGECALAGFGFRDLSDRL